MTDVPQPRAKRGCLFYGCLSGVACLLILLIGCLLLLWQIKKTINLYTDSQPAPLPTVQMSAADLEALKLRIENFQDALRTGRPTPALTLNSEEINAFIETDANLAQLKGKVYVTIEGDRLKAQVSAPLAEVGLSMLRGRYLNGTGIFAVSLDKGKLVVTPDALVVKGKPVPAVYMERLRAQNLAEGLNNNSRASVGLNHLQELRVSDGRVVLVPKLEQ